MDGTIIPQVTAHRHLGVMLNQKLTWNNHIDNLYTSCARRVGILRRLRNKLQSQVFKKIFIGSIRPKLEYTCAVWSGGPITKLIRLQEAFCHRHKVHLPPLQKRFQFHSLVTANKKSAKQHSSSVFLSQPTCINYAARVCASLGEVNICPDSVPLWRVVHLKGDGKSWAEEFGEKPGFAVLQLQVVGEVYANTSFSFKLSRGKKLHPTWA